MVEADKIMQTFLRKNLTDINSSRSGSLVYTGWPRMNDLGDTNFPRISIITLSESDSYLGIFADNRQDAVILQIDVWTKKDLVFNHTITDENPGSISSGVNTDRLRLIDTPTSVTSISHDGTPFGTVTKVLTNQDFTDPGSLAAGTVEWSKSTGDLNFSAADVTSYDGESITVTYLLVLEGTRLCQWYARQIIKTIRTLWRTDDDFKPLFYPEKLANDPIPWEEDDQFFRRRLDYRVQQFNTGE